MANASDVRGLAAPARPPRGEARVPASKSEAIRALLAASIGTGLVEVGPLPPGEDGAAALLAVERLGAAVERADGVARVRRARGAGTVSGAAGVIPVGESATLARCATALCAFAEPGSAARVEGAGTLARRRSPPLFHALASAGAALELLGPPDGWPVLVRGGASPAGVALADPVSSQEVSALLLALSGAGGGELRVAGAIPSAGYLALTRAVLARFGVRVDEEEHGAGARRFRVAGRPALVGRFELEPDATLAAVPLAAACLAGGELAVRGLAASSPQGPARLAQHLRAFGCRASAGADGLCAGGRPTRGAELDLALDPDLAPVLAALAADAALRLGRPSRLLGLGTLAGKESDRLLGTAEALRAAGAAVSVAGSALEVAPGGRRAQDLVLDPRGDHRMAFLHALLGLVVPGVATRGAGCVAKTWPAFFEDMQALGFEVVAGA